MITELAQKYNLTEELTEMVYSAFCGAGDMIFEYFMTTKMWDGATLGDWLRAATTLTETDWQELKDLGFVGNA